MSARFLLAQISDTHVRTDDDGAAARQLQRAIAQAKDYEADAILITGDLVNEGRADEYAALAEVLRDPPAPLYVLPGNHDDRDHLRDALRSHAYLPKHGRLSFVVDNFPVRIVAIDQIVPGETFGMLTKDHARWLDRTLKHARKKPTLVAMHHPPFLTHDVLFDEIGLRDRELFESVIARHKQVQRIVSGHHHRVSFGQVAHSVAVTAPSSSWVYGLAMHRGQPVAPKTGEEPGWMLHAWVGGKFASHFMGL